MNRNIISNILLAMLTLYGCLACGLNGSPGEGEKVGQIVKLSRVGMFAKTWEGEIVRGGFSGGAGVNGQAFDFTIESDTMAQRVKAFMESQREVRIRYRSEGVYSLTRTENGGHFLVSIEPTTPAKP